MSELENEPAICLKTTSYSGYLAMHDFIERYLLIKKRISNSLTREELAFLLGRTPYFINDYEDLSNTTKLDLIDIDLLNLILKRNSNGDLSFDKKNVQHDISHEKSMVRVTRYEYSDKLEYIFNHRWVEFGENQPLKITEPIFQPSSDGGEEIRLITYELTKLFKMGYFNTKRSPLEMYHRVWSAYKYQSSAWSIVNLKNIIYGFIRTEQLIMDNLHGHFSCQVKSN